MGTDSEHNTESGDYSYTKLVAPIFAGFSLPAIIAFADGQSPKIGPPWHNIILSLMAIATSLFIASILLMTDPIMTSWKKKDGTRWYNHVYAGTLRGLFSMTGICVVAVALFIFGWKIVNQGWALAVFSPLIIGSIVPAGISVWLWFKQKGSGTAL